MDELKTCSKCGIAKPPESFYKRARVNGLSYTCKECHRAVISANKKDPTKHNYWYKRYERIRNSAHKRGIEFGLTLDDIKEFKSRKSCYYCNSEVDTITMDRFDNNRGYVRDNIIPCCYLCNKIKNTIDFTKEEMAIIGQAINSYHKRKNE